MRERYLEVTFRHGRPLAAYLYLPRQDGQKSVSTRKARPGLLIDFAADGKPIGLEITAPGIITLQQINEVLDQLGLESLSPEDIAPIAA